MSNALARAPQMEGYSPIWCHHHCTKMMVKEFDKEQKLLVIAGSAASLRIYPVPDKEDLWMVDWEVVQSRSEKCNGRIAFTSDQLKAAFGLSNEIFRAGEWLIKRYGGESAAQFKFIRWKNFLNIPCPGTGHDGDPNISLEIGEKMKNRIRLLLE